MSNLANLGTFKLGQVQLGASVGHIGVYDGFSLSELDVIDIDLLLEDSFSLAELMIILNELGFADGFAFAESGFYPTEGLAAILGRIVLRMDVTSADFCAMVDEAGMSIEINDEPGRAFCFIKQRGQKFDHGIEIFPGDAVMFSCPEDDPILEVDDVVFFNGYIFDIIAIRNKYVDGNVIYRKSALRRLRTIPELPAVLNLIASPNLEGKTTLTWDEVDKLTFPWLDHYEIHESVDDVDYFLREETKSNSVSIKNLTANAVYYYKARAVDKYGRTGAFSSAAATPVDTTAPGTPTGLR